MRFYSEGLGIEGVHRAARANGQSGGAVAGCGRGNQWLGALDELDFLGSRVKMPQPSRSRQGRQFTGSRPVLKRFDALAGVRAGVGNLGSRESAGVVADHQYTVAAAEEYAVTGDGMATQCWALSIRERLQRARSISSTNGRNCGGEFIAVRGARDQHVALVRDCQPGVRGPRNAQCYVDLPFVQCFPQQDRGGSRAFIEDGHLVAVPYGGARW